MIPLHNYGVKCMSMGFLMEPDKAAVWRGPMVSRLPSPLPGPPVRVICLVYLVQQIQLIGW
jgi:hypothetical protein